MRLPWWLSLLFWSELRGITITSNKVRSSKDLLVRLALRKSLESSLKSTTIVAWLLATVYIADTEVS